MVAQQVYGGTSANLIGTKKALAPKRRSPTTHSDQGRTQAFCNIIAFDKPVKVVKSPCLSNFHIRKKRGYVESAQFKQQS
jgi:hypothetical protein